MAKQPKFGRPELHRFAGRGARDARDIHLDVGIAQLIARQSRPDPAQHGADPRQQLARAEGLGDIIVGAGFQATDAVGLFAARGQHDDRHVGRRPLAPQAPADLDPGHAFDHPVEDDEIGRSLLREKKRLFSVCRADDVIAFALEMPRQQIGKRAIVFDEQEPGLGHALPPVARAA